MRQKTARERWLELNNTLRLGVVGVTVLLFGGTSLLIAAQTQDLLFTLAFVLATIGLIELGIPLLRQARAFDASRVPAGGKGLTPWVVLGRLSTFRGLFGTLLVIILFLGMGVFILYLLRDRLLSSEGPLPWTFTLAVGMYAVYFVGRRPIIWLARPIARYLASVVPSYTLQGDTIGLDLKYRRVPAGAPAKLIGRATEPGIVTIRFDELEEIRPLSWSEYQAFMEYEVGPDIPLMVRHAQELLRFTRGEGARPAVFLHVSGHYPIVLLRGPDIYYVVSFAQGAEELVQAFEAFKRRRGSAPA